MKKLFSFVVILLTAMSGMAQDVENLEIGPYEVEYRGQDDYQFRLKRGVNLYDFFQLKKDTIIQVTDTLPADLKNAIQVELYLENCLTNVSRHSSVYGLSGSWKQRIGNKLFFNGGLSFGFAFASGGVLKYNMLEIGVPLSVELGRINRRKASLYGSLGLTPAFYSTLSAKYEPEVDGAEPKKYSGLYLAPQLSFGGYIPVGTQIVKVGIFFKHKINCSTKDYDLYHEVIGKTYLGANVGILF